MLSPEQREQVQQLIWYYIGDPPSPVTMNNLFELRLAGSHPPGLSPYALAGWFLDRCLASPKPDLFIRVVTTVDAAGVAVEVHNLVRRLRQDASLWKTKVLDELWVPTEEWPFIDRQQLRAALTDIADGEGPGAITIEGSTGYGKRTMCAYIERLAARRRLEPGLRAFRPVVQELGHRPEGFLKDLVNELRWRLGMDLDDDIPDLDTTTHLDLDDDIPDLDTTTHLDPERRAVVWARNLTRHGALLAPEPVWLVANVVEVTGLEEGVLRFIDELLSQVQSTPAEVRRLHVVLLASEVATLGPMANLPDPSARYILPEVDEAAVTEWLKAAEPGKADQLYEAATQEVLLKARPHPASMRLKWLALYCVKAQEHLAARAS